MSEEPAAYFTLRQDIDHFRFSLSDMPRLRRHQTTATPSSRLLAMLIRFIATSRNATSSTRTRISLQVLKVVRYTFTKEQEWTLTLSERMSLAYNELTAIYCHTMPGHIMWLWLMMRFHRIILAFWYFGRGYEPRPDTYAS